MSSAADPPVTAVGVFQLFTRAVYINYAIAAVGYAFAAALKTEKFFDLVGTSTLVLLTALSLIWGEAQHPRQFIQSACAILWAVRLGYFMTSRLIRKGFDKAFDGVRDNPMKFLGAWFGLGIWTLCNIIPTFIQNIKTDAASTPIGILEYAGWGMWCLGFVVEWLADHQKTVFKAQSQNKDKFITTGLWHLSRHPNYFGESIMWIGLYLSAFNLLEGWEHLCVISALFPTTLTSLVTGPALERDGLEKWGGDPKYQQYLAETPYIIPSITNLFR